MLDAPENCPNSPRGVRTKKRRGHQTTNEVPEDLMRRFHTIQEKKRRGSVLRKEGIHSGGIGILKTSICEFEEPRGSRLVKKRKEGEGR